MLVAESLPDMLSQTPTVGRAQEIDYSAKGCPTLGSDTMSLVLETVSPAFHVASKDLSVPHVLPTYSSGCKTNVWRS